MLKGIQPHDGKSKSGSSSLHGHKHKVADDRGKLMKQADQVAACEAKVRRVTDVLLLLSLA